MRGREEERERRVSGGGATRDLRDQVVSHTARWLVAGSSSEAESCRGGGVGNSVAGVLGGVRDEARTSNWREM